MDYCLDAGDGAATFWSGPDAVDLDGDGLFDDLMADDDGDGLADHATLDLDDDGTPEARYTDDGTGTWMVSGEPDRPLRWLGLDGGEHTGPGDVDGDGTADRFLDTDRNGLADRAVSADGASGYVDTDGDGRWDLRLIDADGDGTADSAGRL
jgi:hypothetical protein